MVYYIVFNGEREVSFNRKIANTPTLYLPQTYL